MVNATAYAESFSVGRALSKAEASAKGVACAVAAVQIASSAKAEATATASALAKIIAFADATATLINSDATINTATIAAAVSHTWSLSYALQQVKAESASTAESVLALKAHTMDYESDLVTDVDVANSTVVARKVASDVASDLAVECAVSSVDATVEAVYCAGSSAN